MLFLRFCPTLFLESVNTDFENLFLSKLHFRLFTTFSQTSTSNKPNSIFSFLHVSFFRMLFFVVNGYVSIFFGQILFVLNMLIGYFCLFIIPILLFFSFSFSLSCPTHLVPQSGLSQLLSCRPINENGRKSSEKDETIQRGF